MIRPLALRSGLLLAFALIGCTEELTGPRSDPASWPSFTTVAAVNDKIAFMRQDNTQSDIWVMNPDGTEQTNITDLPGSYEWYPSWSPDGRKIVFESDRAGFGGSFEIYVMNADGTGWTRLTNSEFGIQNNTPAWSPVGDRIAFVRHNGAMQQIWVMNTDGSNQIQLTNDPFGVMQPSWSPDASKIVFVVMNETSPYGNEIYVMNANGTGLTRLTNNSNSESEPEWSPDGSKIAFASNNGFKTEILTMNPDGTGQASLTVDLAEAAVPAWSPDGTRIAFVGGGGREIYVMNADGTGATNVGNTPSGQTSYSPSWGTDPDADNDGIYDPVDTAPATVSSDFSDIPLGGKTAGTIVSVPANTKVTIDDASSPGGVRVRVTATGAVPNNARVHITLTGKQAQHKLAVPGTYVITDPVNSSIVAVEDGGPAEMELTLNGSPIVVSIAEGASATVNETTNSSGVLTDVTVSDVTGNSGDVTVNDAPVEPGSPPVAPSVLDVKLTVNRGKLTLTGTFTPAGTASVDPGVSDVTIEAGPYSFVKTGGLTRNKSGAYTFAGTLPSAPGVQFTLELKPPKTGRTWTVKAAANPVAGFVNPVTVSVQVGNVAGGAQVTATLR